MAGPQQGEVYDWPEVSENQPMRAKRRMWVVVSRTVFNEHSEHVLACPLTSYEATRIDIEVRATPHNPLSHTSALLPRMITPIRKSELVTCRGQLPRDIVAQVAANLCMIIEA